jgi:uncharacterized protein YcbK (DUF882 family)
MGAAMLMLRPVETSALFFERPEGRLSLYNTHTGERLKVTYRNERGEYDHDALKAPNLILRCHYTGEQTGMDMKAIEFVGRVVRSLGGSEREVHIISGYRSPAYNNLLISQGRGVAKNSLHLQGKAIDFRVPSVELSLLKKIALSIGYGGVGYYPRSGFIHLDSGRFRFW